MADQFRTSSFFLQGVQRTHRDEGHSERSTCHSSFLLRDIPPSLGVLPGAALLVVFSRCSFPWRLEFPLCPLLLLLVGVFTPPLFPVVVSSSFLCVVSLQLACVECPEPPSAASQTDEQMEESQPYQRSKVHVQEISPPPSAESYARLEISTNDLADGCLTGNLGKPIACIFIDNSSVGEFQFRSLRLYKEYASLSWVC